VNLPFRVFNRHGRLVGASIWGESAAALVSIEGAGATVRLDRKVVWREGEAFDGFAGESYDGAAGTMLARYDEQVAGAAR
jgi:hypothetical protein